MQEIERVIEDKEVIQAARERTRQENRELVDSKLLEYYKDYKNIFSIEKSNILPELEAWSYTVRVEKGKDLKEIISYRLLYKQSIDELLVAKKYIVENLDKGFIAPSYASFALLVIIARKSRGDLRFYIDYRKLNTITQKN